MKRSKFSNEQETNKQNWQSFDQQQQESGILLTNLSGYCGPGVFADVPGMNIQSCKVKSSGSKEEILDRSGRILGLVTSKLKSVYTLSGYLSGTTGSGEPTFSGVVANSVGEITTVACAIALGGVSGALIIDDLEVTMDTAKLNTVVVSLTMYGDIPTTATTINL